MREEKGVPEFEERRQAVPESQRVSRRSQSRHGRRQHSLREPGPDAAWAETKGHYWVGAFNPPKLECIMEIPRPRGRLMGWLLADDGMAMGFFLQPFARGTPLIESPWELPFFLISKLSRYPAGRGRAIHEGCQSVGFRIRGRGRKKDTHWTLDYRIGGKCRDGWEKELGTGFFFWRGGGHLTQYLSI